MDQAWFEMVDIRRRRLASAVWIPLRAVDTSERKEAYAEVGYQQVFFGAGSVAFPVDQREAAERLGWSDIGIGHSHGHWMQDHEYFPCDRFDGSYRGGPIGLNLVLDQSGHGSKKAEWHLHQDLVMALALFREEHTWICPREGYAEIARL